MRCARITDGITVSTSFAPFSASGTAPAAASFLAGFLAGGFSVILTAFSSMYRVMNCTSE